MVAALAGWPPVAYLDKQDYLSDGRFKGQNHGIASLKLSPLNSSFQLGVVGAIPDIV